MITQGNWKIKAHTRRDSDNIRWVMSGKQSICQTFNPNAEANARLIASAPELLAALKGTDETPNVPMVLAQALQPLPYRNSICISFISLK